MTPTYAAIPTREQLQAEVEELKRLLAREQVARRKAENQALAHAQIGARCACNPQQDVARWASSGDGQ